MSLLLSNYYIIDQGMIGIEVDFGDLRSTHSFEFAIGCLPSACVELTHSNFVDNNVTYIDVIFLELFWDLHIWVDVH
ncbi:hypothetical protein CR513_48910, partial [Mucuna pruriens]